ncbi:MAG: AsnC family transcriptional regulator [Nitrososphaeraceae archaeon]|nr:AsnC family transcriptional regulator [Nitrososphaeraceae archaeon]
MKIQQFGLDKKDIEIIRMLAKDCRSSYRGIALALEVTTTTIKLRVQKLIANNIIEKFVTNVNPALFRGNVVCILIVRCRDPNDIAQQLSLFGDLSVQVDCLGGVSAFHIIISDDNKTKKEKRNGKRMEQEMEKKIDSFVRDLRDAQVRNVFINNLVPSRITLNETDIRIMKCLVQEPRMNITNIAKAISYSEKTIQRRLDRMKAHHLFEFTLVPNPCAIRGYIYFGMVISLDKDWYQHIIEYIYLELEQFFLRPPPVTQQEVIILNMYTDNFFDIEKILKKVESLEGVKMVEVFHAIRIKHSQSWLTRELDERLGNKSNTGSILAKIRH